MILKYWDWYMLLNNNAEKTNYEIKYNLHY